MIDSFSFIMGGIFATLIYIGIDMLFEYVKNRAQREAREEYERKRVGFGE